MLRYDRFFTMWVLVLHMFPIFGNTFTLALIVAIGSVFLRKLVAKEPMTLPKHILLHFVPLLLIKPPPNYSVFMYKNWEPFIMLLTMYLIYHDMDICKLYMYYEYSTQALHNKI